MELQEYREWPNVQKVRGYCCCQLGDVQDCKSLSPHPSPVISSSNIEWQGVFSGDKANKYQVDKEGLRSLTVDKMAKGLQSREGNEMAGLEGRTQLLVRLADAMEASNDFFGQDGRPGNMLGKFQTFGISPNDFSY